MTPDDDTLEIATLRALTRDARTEDAAQRAAGRLLRALGAAVPVVEYVSVDGCDPGAGTLGPAD